MKFFHPNGFVRASEMVEYVADALDVLLREAEGGQAKASEHRLSICALRDGRRASRPFSGVLDLLAERRESLWIATREDIARSFAAQVPAT